MLKRLMRSAAEERAISFQTLWGSGADMVPQTWAGNAVNYDTALSLSTVYSCVRLLSDTISTLPADTFFRKDGERLPFRPKPAWVDMPDQGITREDHIQQVVYSMLLSHGACVRKYRNSLGEVVALVALDPLRVEPRYAAGGRLEFWWDSTKVIPAEDMIYLPMIRKPGQAKGVSPLDEVKQTLGLASALDEFAARFFSGGSTVSGIIEAPAVLTPEQALDAKTAFEATHKGNRNSHRVAVLGGGGKFTKTTVDPENAQMLESRRFAVEQIAAIFRVPLHMLMVAAPGVQTYASNEQNAIQFATYTLRPIIAKIEAAYSPLLPGGAFLRFNMDAILRGDLTTRYTAYSQGIQAGFLTINDIHRWEDMRPVPGGDVYRVPLANVNLSAADLVELDKRVTMAQKLVNSGFDPADALKAMGLDPIIHTGLPSVQLQPTMNIDPNDPASAYPVRSLEALAEAIAQASRPTVRKVERDEQGFISRIVEVDE
jgi:HK97 family phage portal protein